METRITRRIVGIAAVLLCTAGIVGTVMFTEPVEALAPPGPLTWKAGPLGLVMELHDSRGHTGWVVDLHPKSAEHPYAVVNTATGYRFPCMMVESCKVFAESGREHGEEWFAKTRELVGASVSSDTDSKAGTWRYICEAARKQPFATPQDQKCRPSLCIDGKATAAYPWYGACAL